MGVEEQVIIKADVVEAGKLLLRDGRDEVRAALEVDEQDRSRLRLFASSGKVVGAFGTDDNGAASVFLSSGRTLRPSGRYASLTATFEYNWLIEIR